MSTADNRKTKPVFNLEDYQFIDTSFSKLMQRRIRKVLLICSSYDAFMLEEDGRIDEQIFNEYASLNLRYPPIFIHAESYKRALEILDSGEIDLVIEMLSTGDVDPFQLAKQIKNEHPDTPIVVLTHFSREVSLRLENEDLSAIDYVFSWLGNADLLLAIIKLIEDKMNAEHDIQHVGVQAILLIEDSIRYTSTYLPNLYKIIFVQSLEFMKEGLNEHQKMLRMRGRPKILLATNFDEALALYRKYRDNLLGVISDVSYKKSPNRRDTKTKAGLGLTRIIKKDNIHLPVLLQSSDVSNEKYAQHLGAGFLHKYSKNLSIDLREYIKTYFLFGDFIFRNPKTMEEYAVASDLQSLQQIIHTLPDDVFLYHTSRNDLTKWLNSRALFPLANMFRDLRVDDFDNLSDARDYIHRAIATFRTYKGRGVIAQFDPERYDEYMAFTRIGDGSIGGKARGLAFINTLIKKYNLHNRFPQARVSIPKTIVISTDVFEEFMESNALYDVALSQARDEEILQAFVKAKLPDSLRIDLARIISVINKPIAVRSSSKLEDSHFQPFAGIYSTYMVPINPLDPDQSVSYLEEAIKSVYASVYYKSSKAYMMVTSNVIDEEKMGIVLQEICGIQVG
ncbi:MAG: PEP/pyruvate-binding domain-containing protein, partial [Bacteroidota bacterium]